jgi:ADP-heptose:LPS heptosyltransferase/predicted SAM-dependent methyltransferase
VVWKREDPQGDETGKIRWELVPFTRGLGYDIGCGPSKAFPHFIGIDNRKDVQMFGIAMDPDLTVPDACHLPMLASSHADFVYSSHTLEHIKDHEKALKEWWRVLKPGGHLCLYLPHKDFYPNIGVEGANPDHVHDFHPQDITAAMKKIGGWDLVVNQERNEGTEYSFFQVYKKYADAKIHRFSCDEPKPTKTCGIVRYGAWGDVIQMSSILPALKAEGYHITLYTVARAWEAVKHDPNIDAVVLQDHEQVPNGWLGPFWEYLAKKYDRFINLSESVEGSLLAMPGRMPYYWNTAARQRYMQHNYLEVTHQIAGVKFDKPLMRYVATEEERAASRTERKRMDGAPLIMWVLAGSSIHKVWGGVDSVLARILLTFPQAKVITVGDERARDMIEALWVKEPRILRRSGVWNIRQTMGMAQLCDMVIGPETGVMNAVAMEPMPKIALLSHSSVENLTRDWVNTYSISSKSTPCQPCHKMIYAWDQCVRDEASGTAQCQADIHPDQVWEALTKALQIAEAA